MAIEFELKFRAGQESFQALKDFYNADAAVYRMQTTYYDTPSGALSQRHYTLRRRMENDLSVCTLKCPAADGRQELEIPCTDIVQALPVLSEMGAPADFPVLVQEGLISVCGAQFTRLAVAITLPDCTVELALDEGILTGGDRTIPLCEVEVELKTGSKEAATAFALDLAVAYGLTPEKHSKFRRALALYKGETV